MGGLFMLQATFISHSGFLVETDQVLLLFDWCEGTLPPLPEPKKLLVFSSHSHEDHFSPAIFSLDDENRVSSFILGDGIALTEENLKKWNVSDATAAKCKVLSSSQLTFPLPGVRVETLPSTDEGVAFLLDVNGLIIFHAGDLNWWHWEGEDPAWNRSMEIDFKRYVEPLRNRRIDLAMLPLDPRLDKDGFRGPQYLLELADIRACIPMHPWENFAFTNQFLKVWPQYSHVLLPVHANGEIFSIM